MNASELAKIMLEWQDKRKELDALEAEIKAAVLELGKTQTVGSVRASYSAGRGSYDYEKMVYENIDPFNFERMAYEHQKVTIDLKAVADAAGIPAEVRMKYYTCGDPTVSLKLTE